MNLSIFPITFFKFIFCFIKFMHNHGYAVGCVVQNGFIVLSIFILLSLISICMKTFFLKFYALCIKIAFTSYFFLGGEA